MAPVKDKEIGEIIEILERLGETSTDTEGIMSLNQALGLASRASMDIMYHPKKYKEKMDSEFLTETELSVIIDKLAEQGIDVTSIISNSTLNNASEAAISALAS